MSLRPTPARMRLLAAISCGEVVHLSPLASSMWWGDGTRPDRTVTAAIAPMAAAGWCHLGGDLHWRLTDLGGAILHRHGHKGGDQ